MKRSWHSKDGGGSSKGDDSLVEDLSEEEDDSDVQAFVDLLKGLREEFHELVELLKRNGSIRTAVSMGPLSSPQQCRASLPSLVSQKEPVMESTLDPKSSCTMLTTNFSSSGPVEPTIKSSLPEWISGSKKRQQPQTPPSPLSARCGKADPPCSMDTSISIEDSTTNTKSK